MSDEEILAATASVISDTDFNITPAKQEELNKMMKAIEDARKRLEETHEGDLEIDGIVVTETQKAAYFAFEALEDAVQEMGLLFTEARDMIDTIQIVINKTGDTYFKSSLITELQEPLINLGFWIKTMKTYTQNIQQKDFQTSIQILEKIKQSYESEPAKYQKLFDQWTKQEIAKTSTSEENWVLFEKAIGTIADQFLSAYSAQKIKELMTTVTNTFNKKSEDANQDMKNAKQNLQDAQDDLAQKEKTRNYLNFLWLVSFVGAAIGQAVMASQVAAAKVAVQNAANDLRDAISAGLELVVIRGYVVKALTAMNAVSMLKDSLSATSQIMKYTAAQVTALVKETLVQIEIYQMFEAGFASELLLDYYKTNSTLLVKYVSCWDILQSKTISGQETIKIPVKY